MKNFKNLFLTGLLFIIPGLASIWVMIFLYNTTLRPVAAPLVRFVLKVNPTPVPPVAVAFLVNIVSAVLLIGGIVFIGWLAKNVIGRRLIRFGEWIVTKVPILRAVYSGVKQFMELFFTGKDETFKQVVLVEYPRKNAYVMAFVGSRIHSDDGIDMVNVFVPTTPNPTSGFFVIFRADEVMVVDVSIEEAMRIIMSAGVLFPASKREHVYDLIKSAPGNKSMSDG